MSVITCAKANLSPLGPMHAGRLQSNCPEAENKVYSQGTGPSKEESELPTIPCFGKPLTISGEDSSGYWPWVGSRSIRAAQTKLGRRRGEKHSLHLCPLFTLLSTHKRGVISWIIQHLTIISSNETVEFGVTSSNSCIFNTFPQTSSLPLFYSITKGRQVASPLFYIISSIYCAPS